jgi:hypothetical protein
MYTHGDQEYGRVFVRTKLCKILVDVCPDPSADAPALLTWNTTCWIELLQDLAEARTGCLRSDCTAHVPHEKPDATKREDRASLPIFSSNYVKVMNACDANSRLAGIRVKLQRQIASRQTGPPNLDPHKVKAILYVTVCRTVLFCNGPRILRDALKLRLF